MNANLVPLEAADPVQLPARYEAARKALAECDEIDEVKSWTDRAAAIKVYARQARDTNLHMMALRIQLRAERRLGELMKQIPSASIENLVQNRGAGREPSRETQVAPTRTQVAEQAGLSVRQRKTALRIAAIPEETFEQHVESATPPTVTQLAALGKAPAVSRGADLLSQARVALASMGSICEKLDPREAAQSIPVTEADTIREQVHAIDQWLDRLVTNLRDE